MCLSSCEDRKALEAERPWRLATRLQDWHVLRLSSDLQSVDLMDVSHTHSSNLNSSVTCPASPPSNNPCYQRLCSDWAARILRPIKTTVIRSARNNFQPYCFPRDVSVACIAMKSRMENGSVGKQTRVRNAAVSAEGLFSSAR